jgi:hypothetical protein
VAYDAQLAARVRELFADDPAVRELAMFGALAFVVDGRVAVAAGGWPGAGSNRRPSAFQADAHTD